MATLVQVLMILVLCVSTNGQISQFALWPPKCCLEDQFTMTFRGIIGDLVSGNSFGYSNLASIAFDFKNKMMASEGAVKYSDGTTYTYKTIQDFGKQSIWTISDGSCSWARQEGAMGTSCLGDSVSDVVYHGSFNYMGYIPTYTWRITVWEEHVKGFQYISVTEDECLPVTANFGGYNDIVVPKPETVSNGGNFYNYTSGITDNEARRYFSVPGYCPPAPPLDLKKRSVRTQQNGGDMFAPAKMLMEIREMVKSVRQK